ncbi:MAG TPA: hypothetical protein VKU41_03180 [Polyangiaceae bacterium]|nr:hypothetical protein [Polyangiaceae bacterium]
MSDVGSGPWHRQSPFEQQVPPVTIPVPPLDPVLAESPPLPPLPPPSSPVAPEEPPARAAGASVVHHPAAAARVGSPVPAGAAPAA